MRNLKKSCPLALLAIGISTFGCKGESAAPGDKAGGQAAPSGAPGAGLLAPEKATASAPDKFAIKLETTKGDIYIDVDKSLAPIGADRIYNLVKVGYFEDLAFFRVISGFMVQVGLHGRPEVNAKWREARIPDDPPKASNTPGMVSFATAGPNTRTTQFFINFGDNARLDGMGFAPFGKVRDMAVVNQLFAGYGEGAPGGRGPNQGLIQQRGNEYLKAEFPDLDYIKRASIVE